MSTIKNPPVSVRVACTQGTTETECAGLFTVDTLPGIILAITADLITSPEAKIALKATGLTSWGITEYRTGRRVMALDSIQTGVLPSIDLAIGMVAHKVAEISPAKFIKVVEREPAINDDVEDWLL